MWESGNHSHPRRGLGFMDEAAEDFSCNIMPEPLPAPYIPPPPPRLLSPIRSTRRHEILLFFSAMTIFFFFNWTKRKPAGCVIVANLVGAREKKCGYRLHKWPAWTCRSQTKYRIWATVAAQAFPVFVTMGTCAFCCWMMERASMRLTGL